MNELINNAELSANIEFTTNVGIQLIGLSNINKSINKHFIIYKIYNILNNKYYIGQHQTDNVYDTYMGSGDLIQAAIIKYGIENFIKIILFDFDNFEEMNEKEKELVPLSACYPYNKMSYNLKEGGINGQITDESKKKLKQSIHESWVNKSEDEKNKIRQIHHDCAPKGKDHKWYNKTLKENLGESYNIWKEHNTIAHSGENHYMVKNHTSMKNYVTDEQYKKICKKRQSTLKQNNKSKNRVFLYNPLTNKTIMVKREKIEYFLLNGYIIKSPFSGSKLMIKLKNQTIVDEKHVLEKDIDTYKKQGWMIKSEYKKSLKDKTNPSYGKKQMHLNGSYDKKDRIYVSEKDVLKYLNIGYVLGMKPKKI